MTWQSEVVQTSDCHAQRTVWQACNIFLLVTATDIFLVVVNSGLTVYVCCTLQCTRFRASWPVRWTPTLAFAELQHHQFFRPHSMSESSYCAHSYMTMPVSCFCFHIPTVLMHKFYSHAAWHVIVNVCNLCLCSSGVSLCEHCVTQCACMHISEWHQCMVGRQWVT